jgi:thioredoxin reductase
MNRRTGTGHLTEDPKLLETDTGTAICTLRIIAASGSGHHHTHYPRCSPSSAEFAPSPAGAHR